MSKLERGAVLVWIGGLLCASACGFEVGSGGGGTVHSPPPCVIENTPIALNLEVSTRGEGDKPITEIRCLYRFGSTASFSSVGMTLVGTDTSTATYTTTVDAPSQGDETFEYRFEFRFDGHPRVREGAVLPVVPLVGRGPARD